VHPVLVYTGDLNTSEPKKKIKTATSEPKGFFRPA
jgi:hypothetical protein